VDRQGVPYEESIRVPLVVRYDPLVAEGGAQSDGLVLVTDLAPTVAELIGIAAPPMDGTSIVRCSGTVGAVPRHLHDRAPSRERRPADVLRRALGAVGVRPYYEEGRPTEAELYDLVADPYQLENVADAPGYADERATHEAEADVRCVVPPS